MEEFRGEASLSEPEMVGLAEDVLSGEPWGGSWPGFADFKQDVMWVALCWALLRRWHNKLGRSFSCMAHLLWNTVPVDVRLFHWASSFRTALRPCLSQHSTDWGEKTLTLHASFPKTAGTDFSYHRWLVLCCCVYAWGLGKHQLTPLFVDSAQALRASFCFKLCRCLHFEKGLLLGLMNIKLKLLFKAAVCSATWTW